MLDWYELDKEIIKHLGLADVGGGQGYPFYGRAYTLALEPWSSIPPCLVDAINNKSAMTIRPKESISHSFETFVKLYE